MNSADLLNFLCLSLSFSRPIPASSVLTPCHRFGRRRERRSGIDIFTRGYASMIILWNSYDITSSPEALRLSVKLRRLPLPYKPSPRSAALSVSYTPCSLFFFLSFTSPYRRSPCTGLQVYIITESACARSCSFFLALRHKVARTPRTLTRVRPEFYSSLTQHLS